MWMLHVAGVAFGGFLRGGAAKHPVATAVLSELRALQPVQFLAWAVVPLD